MDLKVSCHHCGRPKGRKCKITCEINGNIYFIVGVPIIQLILFIILIRCIKYVIFNFLT